MRAVWIMAAYNNEATIASALRSIQAQTVQDWQLIVVNDGSNDSTGQILAEFQSTDSRIIALNNTRNLGLAESLNRAWRHQSADVYVRADADDVCCPQRLELQLNCLRGDLDIDVLGSAATLIDNNDKQVGTALRPSEHEQLAARILRENPFIHPTVVIRRRYLERCGGYDTTLKRSQDYDLWLRGHRQATFRNLAVPLVRYRLRTTPTWPAIYWGTRTLLKAVSRDRLQATAYWYPLRYFAATTLMQLGVLTHPSLRRAA